MARLYASRPVRPLVSLRLSSTVDTIAKALSAAFWHNGHNRKGPKRQFERAATGYFSTSVLQNLQLQFRLSLAEAREYTVD
jgi:hypothetical protein